MEMIVTLIRLVYHDASCIRLKLEIADAVKFYVSHHVWKHPLDKDGAYFARVVFLAAQSFGYIPDKVPPDFTYLALFCPNNEYIFMFWGKNMSNNGVFSLIVCAFASK